jgi:acyl-CoA thioester hydrolase
VDSETRHSTLLAQFPVVIAVAVQWGDQDAFGHVNNTVPLRWFESARVAYNSRVGLLQLYEAERIGPILAALTCDYRRQITFPDTVHVGVRVVRIGRSSLGMEHVVTSENQGAIVAEGTATAVVFDYRLNQSHPVPAAVRHAIGALEGRSFE